MAADTHERIFGLTALRAVTPGAGNNLAISLNGVSVYPRAIYLSASADVVLTGVDDTSSVTLTALAGGMWHPICAKSITSVSTGTATVGY